MSIDAVIVADIGTPSLSGSNPLRLEIGGKPAILPVIQNYIENNGKIVDPVDGEDRASWSSAPRLNGIHLLSLLSRHSFKAVLIDRYYQEKQSFRRALDEGPRVIVISTTFIISKGSLRELVADIRQSAPDACVIAGGPFVFSSYMLHLKTSQPDYLTEQAKKDFLFLEVADEPDVDLYIVSQTGDRVLIDVLERIRVGRPFDDLPNTALLNGDYVFGPRIDEVSGMNDSLIEWASLPDAIFAKDVVPVQASMGCRYECAFCNFIKDRRLTFVKPLDRLIRELKQVRSRGVRYVRFVDDNFRLGSRDIDEVCNRFINEDVDLKWMSFVRASTLQHADVELLRRAGCVEVQLGLESAHPAILRNMRKKANTRLYSEVIRDCLAVGINCSCCFIFGFPGETAETIATTIQFIKDNAHPDLDGTFSWSIYPFMVAPLSPVYEPDARRQYNLRGYMGRWSHPTMDWKAAGTWIRKAFLDIDNCGSHYGEENLDYFLNLPPLKRKEFSVGRHRMSKLALLGELDRETMLSAFRSVFCSLLETRGAL